MAARMLGVFLAAVLTCGALVAADERSLDYYCRKVDLFMKPLPETWTDSQLAYRTAMREVRSLANVFSAERHRLADAWRAATFDEACSARSLAYVHALHACRPNTNLSQRRLYEDALKYAQKCLTGEYLERKLAKFGGADGVENLITSDLVAAYYEANPDETRQKLAVSICCQCCEPQRAAGSLAWDLWRKFPDEASEARSDISIRSTSKFLEKHLFRQCASYVRRAARLMLKLRAAASYAYENDMSRLPVAIQEAVFRYNFCQSLELPAQKREFSAQLHARLRAPQSRDFALMRY